MTVLITRMERTAADLRRDAVQSPDVAVARRLLALALILDGHTREDAARSAGMDRQTLRDWVHRYNADGLAGLSDRHGGGTRPRLSVEQEAEVARWIRTGPNVAVDGVVRWRCVDIQARIEDRFGVTLHERSVGKLLHRLRFACMSTPLRYHSICFAVGTLGSSARAIPRRTPWRKRLSGRVHRPYNRSAA